MAVWLDAEPHPTVEDIGRVFNVRLFNNDLYDVPFYRVVARTPVALYGEVLNDRGTPSIGSRVFIYEKLRGSRTLRKVGERVTGRFGRFTWAGRRTSIETWYVAFAVGAPRRGGQTTPAISNPVFARVAPRLLMRQNLRSRGTATVSGRISPAPKGTVELYRLNGRKAKRLARKTIARNGRFAWNLEFDSSGTYELSVLVKPKKSSGYIVTSKPVTVRVQIPVPAPPPPPAQTYQPPAADPPAPTGNEPSQTFGGSCTALGCGAPARGAARPRR